MKVLLILIVGLAFVTPLIRRQNVDNWLKKQKEKMQSGRGLNLPFKIPPPRKVQHDAMFRFVSTPVTRKEYRCMNYQERRNFHDAIQKTKETMEGPMSQYDYFLSQHDASNSMGAHFGPAFGPWHRHYLYQFEKVLQTHSSDCALPYWDSRLETRLNGNPQHSVLFSSHLAGNAVGPVTSGFAANWATIGVCKDIHPTLYRDFDENVWSLFDDETVRFPSLVTTHEQLSVGWDDTFESNHGYVHTAFGSRSHMADLLCSPTDPMFVMHHCFIDNLFERARQNIKRTNPPLKWADLKNLPPGVDAEMMQFHEENAKMHPFDILNRVGLIDDKYTTLYYNYEKSPGDVTGCRADSDCCSNGYSRFVWCHVATGRCLSKVVSGGMIDASFPPKACFCIGFSRVPFIRSGRCKCGYKSFRNMIRSIAG